MNEKDIRKKIRLLALGPDDHNMYGGGYFAFYVELKENQNSYDGFKKKSYPHIKDRNTAIAELDKEFIVC
jgi:hypothetical protein